MNVNPYAFDKHQWSVDASQSKTYAIRVCQSLLDPENPTLLEVGEDRKRRLVVVDKGLPDETVSRINRYFRLNLIDIHMIQVAGGERSKELGILQKLLDAFHSFDLNRRTQPIILFGGGAVLDVCSLAAGIYRRGVPFVKVPTTLLAYIDASVGVKTAINFADGKNLVGSFTPPTAVLLDTAFFQSQEPVEIISGLGEVLKLAVGCDATLLEHLRISAPEFHRGQFASSNVTALLWRSIDIMLRELQGNLFEDQLARAVDLGHSFSQTLELGNVGEAMRHGEAVAIDVIISSIISARRGLLGWAAVERIISTARVLQLPLSLRGVPLARLWRSVCERTLHRGGRQRMPLPGPLGHCHFIDDLTEDELQEAVVQFNCLANASA